MTIKRIGQTLIALLLLGSAGGAAVHQFGARPAVTLDNPQVIVWQKPTTDTEWAEDVKKENFDIKSTGKLEEMRDVHAAKLERVTEGKREVFECPECIKFDLKIAHPEWTQAEIDTEYANQLNQATWEIEKLKQSVERMDNELRLREKGFVIVEGEGRRLFGGTVPPERIRHIND